MNGSGPVPLVGRDEELAVLRAAVRRGVGGPAVGPLLVGGEAGVGKTRLVGALRESPGLPRKPWCSGRSASTWATPGCPTSW